MSDYVFKARKAISLLEYAIFDVLTEESEIICWFRREDHHLDRFADRRIAKKPALKQLIGLPMEKIVPASLATKIKESILLTDENGAAEKFIVEIVLNGTLTILELKMVPDAKSNQVMVIFSNISEAYRTQKYALFQKDLHESISQISKALILVTSDDLDRQIHSALAQIGSLMQIDRSYVFHLKQNMTVMDNTHEWCAPGVEPQIENLRDLPTEIFPWWMEKLTRFENISIPSVAELPPAAKAEQEILESQNIKSVAVVPLVISSELVGFIGFDAVTHGRTFPDETMDLLRLLGDSIVNAMERIKNDSLLSANEQLFHDVVDNVPVLMWMADSSQHFTFFNKGWLDFTGRSFEQECQDGWFQFIHSNEREDFVSAFQTAFDERKVFAMQFRFLRNDGIYRWILINAVPTISQSGEFAGYIGSCTDMTMQKENEYKYRLMSKRIDISTSLSETHDQFNTAANLLQHYLELTLNLFSFDGGGIYLIDLENTKADLVTSLFLPSEFIGQVGSLPLDREPYKTVLVDGIPNYFENISGEKYGFNSLAAIPFYVGKKIGGCINIATKRAHPFTGDDKRILSSIAEEVGKAIYAQKIEESLRQNQKNVDALFNTINDFLFVLDEKGYILEVNNVVLRRLGYTLDELREMNVISLHVPERRDEAQRIVGEMLAGTTEYCPVPLIAKDGTRIDVETNIVLGKWNNHNVIFGVTRDISERKRTEKRLYQTEERNRALIESSPDAIAFFDKTEILAFANPECVQLFGYASGDEMLRMHAADLFSAKDIEVCRSVFSEIFEKRNVKNIRTDLVKKNGRAFTSEICCSAIYDVNSKPEGVIVTVRDITDRLAAEEHLRKSEEENKAIVDAVPDLMFRISRSGLFLDCKVPNIKELYLPPEMFLGKTLGEVLPSAVAEQAFQTMEKSFQSKVMQQFEYSLPIDGEIRYYEDRIVALSNDEALSIVRDITHRKRTETSLHHSEQRLHHAFEVSNDGMWDWDLKENTVFYSPRWKQMLGFEGDEISNSLDEWKKRIHLSEIDGTVDCVQKHLRGETEIYSSEHRVLCKDGKYKWILDRGKIVERDRDGKPARMIGTHTDITRRVESDIQIKRMSIAIEQSSASIVITDLKATIQYANPHFCLMSGYGVDELIGKKMSMVKSGLTPPATIQSLWSTILEGKVWQGEIINKKKNGELYNEHVIISPIKNTSGTIENFIAIQQDITERKRNEAELEWNISLLQMMANSSPLGFLVVDNRDDSILYFNHRFCEIWGITDLEERMKNESMKNNDIIPYCIPILTDPVAFGESCKPLQDPDNSAVVEDEIQFNDNVTIRRYSTQIRGKQGQYFGRFYIFEDITIQKKAEQFLKEKEQQTTEKLNVAEGRIKDMSFFLDQASDAIIVTDMDDVIVYSNNSVEHMYGWNKEELVNNKFAEYFYNSELNVKTDIGRSADEEQWEADHKHQTKTKVNIWIHLRATIITDSSTGIRSILYVITDVTKSRMLQEQASHSQRLESIGTLASGIAHDMNNILGPILIALSHFDRLLPDEKSRDMNNMLKSNILRGSGLIKQILGFSRMSHHDVMVVQIKHIIRELERLIKETFPKSILFDLSMSKELFPVMANPTQMHQVLLNLCVNARDAMPEGGELKIRAENVMIDAMTAKMNIDAKVGPYCRVTVSDNGVGISQSIVNKIYDPFFTTKEVGKGTGLGLFNVASIIKSHKGFIQLETEVGKGTSFQLYIPASTSESINNVMQNSGDFPSGNGETILLVDDEEVIRNITKATLEDYHYEVLTASNGAEALGIFSMNKERIKIVILDVMMPHLDGPSTVRAIRSMNANPQIIMMSGIHTNVKLMKELAIPEENFVTKPFTIDMLLKIMVKCLTQ
jgi:PAS domain S-box-containing protein